MDVCTYVCTYARMDGHLRPALLGQLCSRVDLKSGDQHSVDTYMPDSTDSPCTPGHRFHCRLLQSDQICLLDPSAHSHPQFSTSISMCQQTLNSNCCLTELRCKLTIWPKPMFEILLCRTGGWPCCTSPKLSILFVTQYKYDVTSDPSPRINNKWQYWKAIKLENKYNSQAFGIMQWKSSKWITLISALNS